MKTYRYVLFLRNPITGECVNQHIDVDTDGEFFGVNDLFEKLHRHADKFNNDFTLIGFNVAQIVGVKNENI